MQAVIKIWENTMWQKTNAYERWLMEGHYFNWVLKEGNNEDGRAF